MSTVDPKIKGSFNQLFLSIKSFLSELLDIRSDTDHVEVVLQIKRDITFKGHTIWILISSILIASIGLNANSTAVVIGAMLISPLLGPILGISLGIATNDSSTIRLSIKNFIVMVIISIFTAYLFFELSLIKDTSSELLKRTYPDIRDVWIAFLGGIALVIARAKKRNRCQCNFWRFDCYGTYASLMYSGLWLGDRSV